MPPASRPTALASPGAGHGALGTGDREPVDRRAPHVPDHAAAPRPRHRERRCASDARAPRRHHAGRDGHAARGRGLVGRAVSWPSCTRRAPRWRSSTTAACSCCAGYGVARVEDEHAGRRGAHALPHRVGDEAAHRRGRAAARRRGRARSAPRHPPTICPASRWRLRRHHTSTAHAHGGLRREIRRRLHARARMICSRWPYHVEGAPPRRWRRAGSTATATPTTRWRGGCSSASRACRTRMPSTTRLFEPLKMTRTTARQPPEAGARRRSRHRLRRGTARPIARCRSATRRAARRARSARRPRT